MRFVQLARRALLPAALVAWLTTGCGGDAQSDDGTGGGASGGSNGSGGTGSAGFGGGGAGGSAGTASGGSTSSGGSAGSAAGGNGGAAGAPGNTGGTGAMGGTGATGGTPGGGGGGGIGGAPTPLAGPKIRVMTFNLRTGAANDGDNSWPNRKKLVFDVIKKVDPDILGVQEGLLFQLKEIDAAVPGYKRIGVARDGGTSGEFCAIYYRAASFSVGSSDTFWLSNTPNQAGSTSFGNTLPRIVTWGHFVEKTTKYGFYVYNTHFDHQSQSSREKSAVLLMSKIDGRSPKDPFVVTGDFNAGESNLATRFLKGNAEIDGKTNPLPLKDSFRVLHPNETSVGTAHGFTGNTGGNKIDYVFMRPNAEAVQAFIDHYNVSGKYPSDHFPVVGVLKLPPQ